MSRSTKKKPEENQDKNHGKKVKYRVRLQEDKEKEQELNEFLKEENADHSGILPEK